ncbi:tetratricopeptide repeat protein [Magnetospirillum sp. UT-4]|uniref:transglutaminase family protein n=1 Tax=Magnetospirillum sp. UT-4 TaxID=2681467 RepID=UPI0013840A2B|nr:tetratricopeptide repeat protein [Magnetospirillum sp. UT-4]CAA7616293.1 conserved hypothetical protein [Magnetospirillum sp. UT-4]
MRASGRALRQRLAAMAGSGDAAGLAEAALLLACLERGDDPAPGLAVLQPLTRGLAAGTGLDAPARAGLLVEHLFVGHGFHGGGDEDEPDLAWLLEHRRGGPEALGILWLEAARGAGWSAEALAFPAHFLVRLTDDSGGRAIIDPSGGGRVLEPPDLRTLMKLRTGLAAEMTPDLFRPLSDRQILLRLQNEAKLRHLRRGDVSAALAAVEAALLFAPDQDLLWREAGLMHMRLDHLAAAVAALEQFIARTGSGPARLRTQQLVQEIRARMG